MRPLRLRIRGLRSYRTPREIDFSQVSLMAIVGDTGAGKSSILEAITYALYNATTWDQRSVKQLIADGAQTVTATLEFAVDDHIYRVTRSTSRTQYPPSIHKLECLSHPHLQKIDGESAVNAEIQRLVGLDWKAFVSAVILPQGRFQALLQATPGDRTAILKGIFRLDELAEVRDRADALGRRVASRLAELDVARAQLLPDPAGVARIAEERRQEAANRETELREAQSTCRHLAEAAKAAGARAEVVEGQAGRIENLLAGAAEQLRSLGPTAARLSEEKNDLGEKEADARRMESRLAEELASVDAKNEGREALGRADQILENLPREMLRLREEADELRVEAGVIAGMEEQLAIDEKDAPKLRRRASDVEAETKKAAEAAAAAQHRCSEACRRLLAYREVASSHQSQETLLVQLERQVKERRVAVRRAEREHESARRTRQAAGVALDKLLRAHAAAHAAEGLLPGDACPICARPVPEGFVAPIAPGVDSAREALHQADEAANEAQKAVIKSQADLAHAEDTLEAARVDLATLSTKRAETTARLLELLPGADLLASDEDVLKPAVSEEQNRLEEWHGKEVLSKELRSAADRADADLAARRRELVDRRARFTTAQAGWEKARQQCEADRQSLPIRFRPEGSLTQESLAVARDRTRARLAELRAVEAKLGDVRHLLDAFSERVSLLDREWRQAVERPRQQVQKNLALLRERIAEAAPMLGRAVPPPPAAGTLEEEIEQADQLEQAGRDIAVGLRDEARACRESAESVHAQLARVLRSARVGSEQELEEAIIAAAATARQAQGERDLARQQEPKAAGLDRRIGEGRRFLATLEELTGLLTDGRFIGHVVGRKQQALLALASDIFASMTGSRYGFAEDFQIVDRFSGQPRPVRTLSGGETFLASLALALGLVELAGRSGGRLDALFLDEGFGSLDANALDSALGELERRASGGRLVAVVSHLRAIAERIETVLSVASTPAGSEVHWLTGSEREAVVREELEEGLLA
jgi:DNA repair protein SbcC/Rad50